MNIHDIDIGLPPLPEWTNWPSTVADMPVSEINEAMQAYARAAIEADRQRRGEPVAWIRKNGFRFNAEIEPQDDSEVPLYAASQPADPDTIRELLEERDALQAECETLRAQAAYQQGGEK